MQALTGRVRAAIEKYAMISPGDSIGVGISGGKDSLALLCALAGLRGYLPQPFTLIALTCDPCFHGAATDYTPVAALCESLGVPYHIRRTELGRVIFEERKESNPCSLCARMRRGILHNMALEAGCNKVALGHHLDDAVETFYLNLFYGGRLGCFSPKSYLSRKGLWLIRPMIFCEEKEVAAAVRRAGLPVVKSACPADGATAREETKRWISTLSQEIPDLRAKTLGALERARLDGWCVADLPAEKA